MNNKGLFIWKAANCADGTLAGIVRACVDLNLSWVALKLGDAASGHSSSFTEMRPAVTAFKQAGLQVWLWHYVYGGVWIDKDGNPHAGGVSAEREAAFALRNIADLQPAGYVIDAEREWKVLNGCGRAVNFVRALGYPSTTVALSSYRFPSMHSEFPFAEFLSVCDCHMPQVYWQPPSGERGPVLELERSLYELRGIADLPFSPIGRAYIGDGHPDPRPRELTEFAVYARQRGCTGISYWAMDFLYQHPGGMERAQAIQAAWPGGTLPPPPPAEAPNVIGRVRVNVDGYEKINLRAGASTTHADVGDALNGTEWFVFEEAGPWVRVAHNAWLKTGAGLADWVVRYAR